MTELPFCLQPSKISDNNDYESYKKGEFELEEWEDVNYCEHSFSYGDKGLTDREVVDLLNELHEENTMLKERRHEDINELSVIAMKYKALENENEQLKQQLQSILKLTKKIEDCIHDIKVIGDFE